MKLNSKKFSYFLVASNKVGDSHVAQLLELLVSLLTAQDYITDAMRQTKCWTSQENSSGSNQASTDASKWRCAWVL